MPRITLRWIVPIVDIEAEEELDVGGQVSEGAVHVTEEEVAKFDGVQAGKEQTPLFSYQCCPLHDRGS